MNRKIFAIAAMMLLMPMMMGAQTLKGSYFLDNSLNRNKLNPAFAPQSGYFQIPVVGNFGVGMMSNLELSTFLYPIDGQLYTFLNKNVTIDQFESALAKNPYMDINTDLNLINFGWKSGKGFWTVDMGVRVNADIDVPRDLFIFMKKGTGTSGSYNIGQVRANLAASVQAAVGYSRDLSDLIPGLRAGAKVRAILPAAYVGVGFDEVSLTTSPDKWTVKTDGALYSAVKGLELSDADGGIEPSFAGAPGLAGFGLSFDLGAEYKMVFDGFINGANFSAAFTDLGFVNYGANAVQAYNVGGQMDWTGLSISLEEGAMNDAMNDLASEFEKLMLLKKDGSQSSLTRSSLPSFYLGAEMPFLNNMMSVGALYSARRSFNYTRNELTLSYNLTPADWFSFGLNYSFLNVVNTMGFLLEFNPKSGVGFHLGLDYLPLAFAKAPESLGIPVLPMSMRANLHFGIAATFGGKK